MTDHHLEQDLEHARVEISRLRQHIVTLELELDSCRQGRRQLFARALVQRQLERRVEAGTVVIIDMATLRCQRPGAA